MTKYRMREVEPGWYYLEKKRQWWFGWKHLYSGFRQTVECRFQLYINPNIVESGWIKEDV